MDILKSKINECYFYLFITILIAIGLPKAFNAFWLCLIGVAMTAVVGYKLYQLLKIKKNENFFEVDVLCTDKSKDYLNFGNAKNYEFEPLEKEKFDDMIYLNLFNDETGSIFNRKKKIKEDCGYTLLFKIDKNGEAKTNQSNFIGYKRYVLPE